MRDAWRDALLRAYVIPGHPIRAQREAQVWERWRSGASPIERVVLEAAIRAARSAATPPDGEWPVALDRVQAAMPPGLAEALAVVKSAGAALHPDAAAEAAMWIQSTLAALQSVPNAARPWLDRWADAAWESSAQRLNATSIFAWALAAASAASELNTTDEIGAEIEVMRRLVAAQQAAVTREDDMVVCRNFRGRIPLPSPMRHPLWGDTHGRLTSPDRSELLSDSDVGPYDLLVPADQLIADSERGVEIALAGIARGETVDQQMAARERLAARRATGPRAGRRERGHAVADPALPLVVLATYERAQGGDAFSGDAILMSARVRLEAQPTLPR